MKKRYDVIVIGAGSGLHISAYAAEQGLKTAIIEQGPFGGTCLDRGCIPSKMLIHTADIIQQIQNSRQFGIEAKVTKIHWKQIINRVNKLVNHDSKQIEHANKHTKNITVYNTQAKFLDNKTIQTGDDILTANKIFICAGTRPSIPPIPGLDKVNYMTSDQALKLQKQPKHLIIIGGGYISSELAHFYGTLGTKVTIIQRGNLLMNNEDTEIAQKITEIYKKRFNVILNANTKSVSQKGNTMTVDLGNKKITGDALLIATGRKPNTDTLGLQNTEIKIDKKGYVNVNDYMETNVSGIWAIGDIAGKYQFKHSANLEAQNAIQNAFHKKTKINYTAMPHASFTSPQTASVGKTEQELKGTQYTKKIYKYNKTGYGKAIEDNDGFVKVLTHKNKILGCHIIGTNASILIHEVILAMKNGLNADQIAQTVHVHPALSEVVQRAFLQ